MWLPSTCWAGLCPSFSACSPVALWFCSIVSTCISLWFSHRAVLCSGRSPQPSGSGYGVRVVFPLQVATALLLAWACPSFDLFAIGLPAVLPLFCFPPPESPGGLLGCISRSLGHPGSIRFQSFLSSDWGGGGGGSSRRDHSLRGSGPPPLTEVGVVRGSSPPLLVILLVIFHRGKVCQSPVSGSQSACRTWFARSIMDLSMFLRNFSVPVGPAELHSPPGVVAFFPQGLTRDLCIPYGLRLSGFLPGHRSSS